MTRDHYPYASPDAPQLTLSGPEGPNARGV